MGKEDSPSSPKKSEDLEKAAASTFGAAAAKASVLVSHQELQMQKACRHLIDVQFKKMELKLQHFQEMEGILDHERKELENERQAFLLDRMKQLQTQTVDTLPAENPVAVAVDTIYDRSPRIRRAS